MLMTSILSFYTASVPIAKKSVKRLAKSTLSFAEDVKEMDLRALNAFSVIDGLMKRQAKA